jgi:hypothetical protein
MRKVRLKGLVVEAKNHIAAVAVSNREARADDLCYTAVVIRVDPPLDLEVQPFCRP